MPYDPRIEAMKALPYVMQNPQMRPGSAMPMPMQRPSIVAQPGQAPAPTMAQALASPATEARPASQAITPEMLQVDPGSVRKSKLSDVLLQAGTTGPVRNVFEGVGKLAQTAAGAYLGHKADSAERERQSRLAQALKGNAKDAGMPPEQVNLAGAVGAIDPVRGFGMIYDTQTRQADAQAQQASIADKRAYEERIAAEKRANDLADFEKRQQIMAERGTVPGNTNVVVGGTTINPDAQKASIKVDQGQMEGALTAAQSAQSMLPQLEQMIQIVQSTPTGFGQEAMLPIKRMAAGLGIDVPKLSDQEVLNSLVQEIVPRMRPPGSGASSDMETRSFQTAVVGLGSTQQANIIRWTGMRQIAERTKAEYELMREYYDDPNLGNGSLRGFTKYVDEQLGDVFPKPKNEEEWSTIPNGTLYIDPNGDYRVKR